MPSNERELGDWIPWTDYLDEATYQSLIRLSRSVLTRGQKIVEVDEYDLLNEALLRFSLSAVQPLCLDREHFIALAVRAMRRVLIDRFRALRSQKRDAQCYFLSKEPPSMMTGHFVEELEVSQILAQLSRRGNRQALVLEMHGFESDSLTEIASEFRVSVRTVKRDLRVARQWAYEEWTRRAA